MKANITPKRMTSMNAMMYTATLRVKSTSVEGSAASTR